MNNQQNFYGNQQQQQQSSDQWNSYNQMLQWQLYNNFQPSSFQQPVSTYF